jgi:hypothetical protein
MIGLHSYISTPWSPSFVERRRGGGELHLVLEFACPFSGQPEGKTDFGDLGRWTSSPLHMYLTWSLDVCFSLYRVQVAWRSSENCSRHYEFCRVQICIEVSH